MDELKQSSLEEIKNLIKDNIKYASVSFVRIGYFLKNVRDRELYLENDYKSIWDFAFTEFGISKPQASKFMAINDKFSEDGNSPVLLEQYKDFSSSKLSEMLYLTDEQLEQVTVGTTVAEIREIKNPEKTCIIKKEIEDTDLMCSGLEGNVDCLSCNKAETVSTSKQEAETIDDLDFTVRTYNCLKRAGVDTIDDLCDMTEDDLARVRNFSLKCMIEVKEKLEGIGRCLKQEEESESVIKEEVPESDNPLSCKFDSSARCLVASKNSCKSDDNEGCMYCAHGFREEDYETYTEPKEPETVEADVIQNKPKRPNLKGFIDDPYCPECNQSLKYRCDCPKCGQKIEWESVAPLFEYEEEQIQKRIEQKADERLSQMEQERSAGGDGIYAIEGPSVGDREAVEFFKNLGSVLDDIDISDSVEDDFSEKYNAALNRLKYLVNKDTAIEPKKIKKINGRGSFVNCGNCGAGLTEVGWKFCPNCGYRIKGGM